MIYSLREQLLFIPKHVAASIGLLPVWEKVIKLKMIKLIVVRTKEIGTSKTIKKKTDYQKRRVKKSSNKILFYYKDELALA